MLGRLEVDADIALAAPKVRNVDRQDERAELVLDRLGDQVFRLRAVAEDVDLEPARRAGSGGGDLGRPRGRPPSTGT
jgi:hypothetical protein